MRVVITHGISKKIRGAHIELTESVESILSDIREVEEGTVFLHVQPGVEEWVERVLKIEGIEVEIA